MNSTIAITQDIHNQNSFSFGSHQSFPLRYGWIEKVCISLMNQYGSGSFKKDELKPEILSQNYGLGNNMAKSLRFWLKACGITVDIPNSNKDPNFTDFAFKIFGPDGEDKYLEKKETIWRLHFNVVTNFKFSSTWFWFFNFYNKQNFDRQQLVMELLQAANTSSKIFNENNIKRDVDCFVRSYVASSSADNTYEDALDCPFVELNLIRKTTGNSLLAKRGFQESIPDDLFLRSINNLHVSLGLNTRTITIESLLNSPFSPGCNFLLSREAMTSKLELIHEISNGAIELDQSSGLAQIVINNQNYVSNIG